MKHVLVTGGAGFIGREMVRLLLDKGYKVTVLDKLTYASDVSKLDKRAFLIEDCITNYGLVKDMLLDRPTHYVINMAAESSVDKSNSGGAEFIKTNITGVHVLLEAIRSYSPQTRFVQVSTDEVLGHLEENDPPFSESSPIQPRNFYSATKAAAEHIVRAYTNVYKLNTIITRCSNNFGPGQHIEKLIPRVIHNAVSGTPIPVYGDGKQVRDWIHVSKHCQGVLAAMESGSSGETYLFGGNNPLKNIDLIDKILGVLVDLGKVTENVRQQITFVKDRPGHDLRYEVDVTHVEKVLPWRAEKESFNELLRKTVESYT